MLNKLFCISPSKTRLLFKASFLFVLTAIFLFGCDRQSSPQSFHITGPTMGTRYTVKIIDPPAALVQITLQQQIKQLLEQLNRQMSTYIPDSEIMVFNRLGVDQWQTISSDFLDVVLLSQKVAGMTDGAFDITIGPLVELWGFGQREGQGIPAAADITDALSRVGWQQLSVKPENTAILKQIPLWLDVSAVAKGYAVDKIAQLLEQQQVAHYLVEVGGEMRVKGYNAQQQLWRIGIETPALLQQGAQQVIAMTDKAIATSGDYRNFFEEDGQRFSHTIDPKTGQPVRHRIASVTVIADTAAEADAFATALNVLGDTRALSFAEEQQLAAYFILHDDAEAEPGYRIVHTSEFNAFLP